MRDFRLSAMASSDEPVDLPDVHRRVQEVPSSGQSHRILAPHRLLTVSLEDRIMRTRYVIDRREGGSKCQARFPLPVGDLDRQDRRTGSLPSVLPGCTLGQGRIVRRLS